MPGDKYIQLLIGGQLAEIKDPENIIDIDYKFEDKNEFQTKQSSQALNLKIPATRNNDKIGNLFWNPSVEDMAAGSAFREPQDVSLITAGIELLVGKAFLKGAKHNTLPIEYEFDLYGGNGDWIIALRETMLYDAWTGITFVFTKQLIIDSWAFDGTDIDLPYVFAPVRYGLQMGTLPSLVDGNDVDDYNQYPEYLKPSISKYWTIYWGFKLIGYTVKSDFFDTEYFRRQTMPWTWGAFLESDGTKMDVMKFLAKSRESYSRFNSSINDFIDAFVNNDSSNGAFDNKNTYTYVGDAMTWTYPTVPPISDFGTLNATFHINVFADSTVAGANTKSQFEVYWYKNGVQDGSPTEFFNMDRGGGAILGRNDSNGNYEDFRTFTVSPGDVISARLHLNLHDSSFGRANITLFVEAFEIAYFRIPLGGTINFANLLGLKQFKFLEFLAGVVDEFNIAVQTDSVSKTVYMEPTHPYAIGDDLSNPTGGYFAGKMLDWSAKQDLSKDSDMELFSDGERELIFKYKDDQNDGGLKKIQDRDSNVRALAKYVFPTRFKAGVKEIENRFFSACIHYDVEQWRFDDLDAPQMVLMSPENIANASSGEAQNTLIPKSCYYKGTTTDYKWVFDGANDQPYPFMFAVNYKVGGEQDPILSYCDETIGPEDDFVIGKGLVRRFFLQRLAIMRNGQYYYTWFHLNNNDVSNPLHREHIICKGQKWELLAIFGYNPLREESTRVLLRKHSPITATP